MRFFVAIAALLSLSAACAQSQARPVVVLVHGRGHLDDDSLSLRRQWKNDLDSALARVGIPSLRDEDVRLAWYADVMDPANDAGCGDTPSVDDTTSLAPFARDFFGSLAAALGGTSESRDARMMIGDVLYALDESRRCGAQKRVAAVIDSVASRGRPVIVVAYSLGSLVSYSVLSDKSRPLPTVPVHLITVGSPLGHADMRALLGVDPDALRLPRAVQSWDNIYHPGDALAAALGLSVKGVRDLPLEKPARGDAHYVRDYLRSRQTGVALGEALCAERTKEPACSRLFDTQSKSNASR